MNLTTAAGEAVTANPAEKTFNTGFAKSPIPTASQDGAFKSCLRNGGEACYFFPCTFCAAAESGIDKVRALAYNQQRYEGNPY